MRPFKSLLILSFLFSFLFTSAQTQEFTDEASFLAALGGVTPAVEDYENCPTYADFTLLGGSAGCLNACSGSTEFRWVNYAEFTFNSPINAFGTFLYDVGTAGPVSVTLMTSDGQSYNAVSSSGGDSGCNQRFFGIISDMDFVMARFDSDNSGDGITIDNTYYATTVISPVPTLSQWGLIILGMIILIFGLVAIQSKSFKLNFS